MAQSNQQMLINLLMRVSGGEQLSKMNKKLAQVSDGTLRLGKNQQFYSKNAKGAISTNKAMSLVLAKLLKLERQQLALGRSNTAEKKRNTTATQQGSSANVSSAMTKNTATIATERNTTATAKNSKTLANNSNITGSATFAVVSVGQAFQDAGQFGMGMAQGVRAVTNNIQMSAQSIMYMVEQQRALNLVTGKNISSMAAFRAAMLGPMGALFAFGAVTAAIEFYANWSQKAKKSTSEITDELNKMLKVVPDFAPQSMVTMARLGSHINELKDQQQELTKETELTHIGMGQFAQRMTREASKAAKDLGDKIGTLEKAYEEVNKDIEGYLSFITTAEGRTAAFELGVNKAKEEVAGLESALRLSASGGLDEYEERINDLEDAIAGGFEKGKKAVQSFRTEWKENASGILEAIVIPVKVEVARTEDEAIERMKAAYADFLATLKKIDPAVKVTRSEFARMHKENEVAAFLAKERERVNKEELKRLNDELKERIRLERIEVKKLADTWLTVKESFAQYQKILARDGKTDGSLATLPGVTQAFQKQQEAIKGGVVTQDGRRRKDVLEEMRIDPSELRSFTDAQLAEFARLKDGVEETNRSMGNSFSAWWRANSETVNASAKLMSQSIGGVGTVLMQIAQQSEGGNKGLFEAGKKFAIAQALINTYLGISAAWALGPILGPVTAAGVAAAGFAQVANIRAAKMGKSGSGSSSAGTAPNLISNYSNASQIPRAIPTGGFGPLFGASAQQYAGSNGFGSLSPVPPPSQRATTVDISLVAEGDQLIGVINDTYQQRVRTIGTGALVMGRGSQTRVAGIKNRFGDDGFNAGWRNP